MKKITASTFALLFAGLFLLATPAFAQSHGQHGGNHNGGPTVVNHGGGHDGGYHGGYNGGYNGGYHGGYNGGYRGGYNGGYHGYPVYVRPGYGRPGYYVPRYGVFPRSGFSVYLGYNGYYADPVADWVWDPYIGEYVRVSYYPNYSCYGFYSSQFGIVIRVR